MILSVVRRRQFDLVVQLCVDSPVKGGNLRDQERDQGASEEGLWMWHH